MSISEGGRRPREERETLLLSLSLFFPSFGSNVDASSSCASPNDASDEAASSLLLDCSLSHSFRGLRLSRGREEYEEEEFSTREEEQEDLLFEKQTAIDCCQGDSFLGSCLLGQVRAFCLSLFLLSCAFDTSCVQSERRIILERETPCNGG